MSPHPTLSSQGTLIIRSPQSEAGAFTAGPGLATGQWEARRWEGRPPRVPNEAPLCSRAGPGTSDLSATRE